MTVDSGHHLIVPQSAVKLVRGLHPFIKTRIKAALKIILGDPYAGKLLKDELEGLRSLRVKRFRVIYRLSDSKPIEIAAIGPRKTIYEETYRIIKREITTGPKK